MSAKPIKSKTMESAPRRVFKQIQFYGFYTLKTHTDILNSSIEYW